MAERRLVSGADRTIARRAAIATMVVALAIVVLAPIVWAIDLIILLATGAEPNLPEGPGVSVVDQWQGLMPITVPWWVFLAFPVALAVLVAVTWRPDRHLPATYSRGILLKVSPGFLAFWALIAAIASLSSGVWYAPSGYGMFWIPALLSMIVFAVAIVRWIQLRTAAKKTRRSRGARADQS